MFMMKLNIHNNFYFPFTVTIKDRFPDYEDSENYYIGGREEMEGGRRWREGGDGGREEMEGGR